MEDGTEEPIGNESPKRDEGPLPLSAETEVSGLGKLTVKLPKDPHVATEVARQQFRVTIAGLIVGLIFMAAGVLLFLRGVQGSTSWTASSLGSQSKLADAAPGTILFVVGLLVIWTTRYKVT
jgi:hypothetical protein